MCPLTSFLVSEIRESKNSSRPYSRFLGVPDCGIGGFKFTTNSLKLRPGGAMANFTSTTITLQQREKNHAGARSKRNGVGNGFGRWKFMEIDV